MSLNPLKQSRVKTKTFCCITVKTKMALNPSSCRRRGGGKDKTRQRMEVVLLLLRPEEEEVMKRKVSAVQGGRC